MIVRYIHMFILMQVTLLALSQDVQWEKTCSQSCGAGIQKTKGNNNKTRFCNVFDCPGDAGCITTHYTFDSLSENRVFDSSNNANHGTTKGDASSDQVGKFGKSLHLPKNANISLGSKTFHNKPLLAITIASWVKLSSVKGPHEIFHTCNSESGQRQYHLEVYNSKVHWSHRDNMARTVFNVKSEAIIKALTWTHIAVSYRTTTRQAKIYINGELTKLGSNSQLMKFGKDARVNDLSPDWSCANIGDYKNTSPLDGYIGDFFIFKCELLKLEIKDIFQTGSFKRHNIPVP